MSSPYVRRGILLALSRGHGLDAPTLTERLGCHEGATRKALSKLSVEGRAERTSRRPKTWTITAEGKAFIEAWIAQEKAEAYEPEEMYA